MQHTAHTTLGSGQVGHGAIANQAGVRCRHPRVCACSTRFEQVHHDAATDQLLVLASGLHLGENLRSSIASLDARTGQETCRVLEFLESYGHCCFAPLGAAASPQMYLAGAVYAGGARPGCHGLSRLCLPPRRHAGVVHVLRGALAGHACGKQAVHLRPCTAAWAARRAPVAVSTHMCWGSLGSL